MLPKNFKLLSLEALVSPPIEAAPASVPHAPVNVDVALVNNAPEAS